MDKQGRYVLVTTEYRGVFAGHLESEKDRLAILTDARCAIYWATTKGLLELAAIGPNVKSKIGSTAPRITLHSVTSITDCTPEAVAAWKSA